MTLGLCAGLLAAGFFAPPARAASPAKLRDAVVKIEILRNGVPVSIGTGFFVSPEGTLVSNRHVVGPAFAEGHSAAFYTLDGRRLEGAALGGCGDRRDIDLCVLKLEYRPKAWFSEPAGPMEQAEPGSKVFVIGHPKGYDFTLSDGIISAWRTRRVEKPGGFTGRIEEVQISAPISPGNSGGPIFDADGGLLGMSTWVHLERDAQNLNFGIAAGEVWRYVRDHSTFRPIQATQADEAAETREADRRTYEAFVAPALASLKRGEAPDRKFFSTLTLSFDGAVYEFVIPKYFVGGCRDASRRTFKVTCIDRVVGLWGLHFEVAALKPGFVQGLEGSRSDPAPLPLAQEMMANGRWEEFRRKLAPDQLKRYFSAPEPYRCERSPQDAGDVARDALVCSARTADDGAPTATSVTAMIQKGASPMVLRISAVAAKDEFWRTIEGTLRLALLSGRRVGAASTPSASVPALPEVAAEEASIASLEAKREASAESWADLSGRQLRLRGTVDKLRSGGGAAGGRWSWFRLREAGTNAYVLVSLYGDARLAEGESVVVEGEFSPFRHFWAGKLSPEIGGLRVGGGAPGSVRSLGKAAVEGYTLQALVEKRGAMTDEAWQGLKGARVRLSATVLDVVRKEGAGWRRTEYRLGRPGTREYVMVYHDGSPDVSEGQDVTVEGRFSPNKNRKGQVVGTLDPPKTE